MRQFHVWVVNIKVIHTDIIIYIIIMSKFNEVVCVFSLVGCHRNFNTHILKMLHFHNHNSALSGRSLSLPQNLIYFLILLSRTVMPSEVCIILARISMIFLISLCHFLTSSSLAVFQLCLRENMQIYCKYFTSAPTLENVTTLLWIIHIRVLGFWGFLNKLRVLRLQFKCDCIAAIEVQWDHKRQINCWE